jgi:hypothetical protein
MPKLVGSTEGIINWDTIVELCRNSSNGDYNTPAGVIERSEAEAEGPLLESYRTIMRTWLDAGYKLEDIQWYDYYPGEHFDTSVEEKFADIVNAEPRRVFVSEVWPGRCVPYHWDVEDKEAEWLAEGELKRWVCFMDKPRWGHVLMFDGVAFYNQPQHEVWEWDNYKDYHAGTNCGTEPYYLFHFLGKPRG